MGCCSTSPRPDLEINYEEKTAVVDVDFENATDNTGARLVTDLATCFANKSKFHDAIKDGIATTVLNFFGNGEVASALQIWGEPLQ